MLTNIWRLKSESKRSIKLIKKLMHLKNCFFCIMSLTKKYESSVFSCCTRQLAGLAANSNSNKNFCYFCYICGWGGGGRMEGVFRVLIRYFRYFG